MLVLRGLCSEWLMGDYPHGPEVSQVPGSSADCWMRAGAEVADFSGVDGSVKRVNGAVSPISGYNVLKITLFVTTMTLVEIALKSKAQANQRRARQVAGK